jgi:FkbM family methyltransferase
LTPVSRQPIVQSVAIKVSDALPEFLLRPEYFFRPSQLVRRATGLVAKGEPQYRVTLPWNAQLVVDPNEHIGGYLWRSGVYDLTVVEALTRLADSGELAVDVGANIGLMTSALASAVGPAGRVISLEPHPLLVDKLQHNVDLWRQRMNWRHVNICPVALSDDDGSATLIMPANFSGNQGRATLEEFYNGERITIQTRKLDGLTSANDSVGVMKIDVEGHEYRALSGASNLLANGRIRDIIFEEYEYPGQVVRLLESHGYSIYGLKKTMFGPRLVSGPELATSLGKADPPNYLATRDPQRAQHRFARMGWQALRRRGKRYRTDTSRRTESPCEIL